MEEFVKWLQETYNQKLLDWQKGVVASYADAIKNNKMPIFPRKNPKMITALMQEALFNLYAEYLADCLEQNK